MRQRLDGRCVFLLFLTSVAVGCSELAYYTQVSLGHLKVMRSSRPIEEITASPEGDPDLRRQLREVQAIRDFASQDLGLPDNGSYRAYADLGRRFVVWNVFATPEFSLEPLRWCMLLVGCVNYRGYYDPGDAERLASELQQQRYDTLVAGVTAYSTLGHFDDPVLNTFLRLGRLEVARIIFHELAHQKVFVAGDTVFNESFATAVESEGLRRWLRKHGTSEEQAHFERQRQRRTVLNALLSEYRQRLGSLYQSAWPDDRKRQEKAILFSALRSDYTALRASWNARSDYDGLFGADLNNARLASLALYSELLPAFERLLADLGNHLPSFYQRAAELAALDSASRRAALLALVEAPAAAAEPSVGR